MHRIALQVSFNLCLFYKLRKMCAPYCNYKPPKIQNRTRKSIYLSICHCGGSNGEDLCTCTKVMDNGRVDNNSPFPCSVALLLLRSTLVSAMAWCLISKHQSAAPASAPCVFFFSPLAGDRSYVISGHERINQALHHPHLLRSDWPPPAKARVLPKLDSLTAPEVSISFRKLQPPAMLR